MIMWEAKLTVIRQMRNKRSIRIILLKPNKQFVRNCNKAEKGTIFFVPFSVNSSLESSGLKLMNLKILI